MKDWGHSTIAHKIGLLLEDPLSQAQQQELERRLENYEKNPTTGSSWEDVKKRLGFSQ